MKGLQVSPTELEDEIKNMKGIFDVSVIGKIWNLFLLKMNFKMTNLILAHITFLSTYFILTA